MPRLSNNRTKFNRLLTVDDVTDTNSLCRYAHQTIGSAIPTAKDMPAVNKTVREFLEMHPDASVNALTDVVQWAKFRKKHLSMVQLFGSWKYANQDGFMTILSRGGSNDDETLSTLLRSVSDKNTRERMIAATTGAERDSVHKAYLEEIDQKPEESDEEKITLNWGLSVGQVSEVQLSLMEKPRYAVIVDTTDDKVIVHLEGQSREIKPHLVKIRDGKEWKQIET